MRWLARGAQILVVGATLVAWDGGRGLQRNATPMALPPVQQDTGMQGGSRDFSMDEATRKSLEEKRGKMMNSERQRLMVREANQLVQTAAELQTSLAQEQGGASKEEALRRADLIEKLAHNVKERMKGAR